MWSIHPRSLRDGRRLELGDLVEALGEGQTPQAAMTSVVSRRALPDEVADSAGKWLLVPGLEAAPSEVPAILVSPPLNLEPIVWQEVLASHAIMDESLSHLATDEDGKFTSARQDDLRTIFEDFLTSRWEYGFEDTPPLDHFEIEDLESDPSEDLNLGSNSTRRTWPTADAQYWG